MAQTQNPPPRTVPSKTPIRKSKTPALDVEVSAEVVADGTTADASVQGQTTFTPEGKADADGSVSLTPGYSYTTKNGQNIISKLTGPVVIKFNVRIQTVYGPDASATQTSAYGRGTTPDDEKAGNTTLGFHESCHRDDYLTYLRTKQLPAFGGKVGQTEAAYQKAAADFQKAMDKYFADMDAESERKTDEVGYKKATFNAKGPRP